MSRSALSRVTKLRPPMTTLVKRRSLQSLWMVVLPDDLPVYPSSRPASGIGKSGSCISFTFGSSSQAGCLGTRPFSHVPTCLWVQFGSVGSIWLIKGHQGSSRVKATFGVCRTRQPIGRLYVRRSTSMGLLNPSPSSLTPTLAQSLPVRHVRWDFYI